MEIKEVEKLLSVSRSNIRFYEKQGLIAPNRRDNNYRDYTEEDIIIIKKYRTKYPPKEDFLHFFFEWFRFIP